MVDVRQGSVTELRRAEGFVEMVQEYGTDCAKEGLPAPATKLSLYHQMEATGVLTCFGAFEGELLVGFATVICQMSPHYGVIMASIESLFVRESWRKSGAGLKLIRAAEVKAREVKSPTLFVFAPTGGALEQVLPRLKYKSTSHVFMKDLSGA